MTAALEQVFASATHEDSRRAQQTSALETLMAGPAKEITALVENIHAASVAARKAIPWRHKLSDDATKLGLDLFAGRAVYDAHEQRLEQTVRLYQGSYGRGIALTFRDDGTMKIEQQNMRYQLVSDPVRYYGAVPKTDRETTYEGPVNTAKAQEQLGVFLSLAMSESARQKLQAALSNITPATGSGPSPRPL